MNWKRRCLLKECVFAKERVENESSKNVSKEQKLVSKCRCEVERDAQS